MDQVIHHERLDGGNARHREVTCSRRLNVDGVSRSGSLAQPDSPRARRSLRRVKVRQQFVHRFGRLRADVVGGQDVEHGVCRIAPHQCGYWKRGWPAANANDLSCGFLPGETPRRASARHARVRPDLVVEFREERALDRHPPRYDRPTTAPQLFTNRHRPRIVSSVANVLALPFPGRERGPMNQPAARSVLLLESE